MKLALLRDALINCALDALDYQLVHGSCGNFSARDTDSDLIAITPSAVRYEILTPADLPVINIEGEIIEGKHKPTSELPMHLAIYREREDVNAIVHTHAPFSLVFACAEEPIQPVVAEAAQCLGAEVPIAPYCTPGSEELAEVVAQSLGTLPAVLLARHGLVTVGETVEQALQNSIATEIAARTWIWAKCADLIPVGFTPQETRDLHNDYHLDYHPEILEIDHDEGDMPDA